MCDTNNDSCAGDTDYEPTLDISALPKVVKDRVKALKKLQFETVKAEEEYYNEIYALDLKYQKKYDEINEKRSNVVHGKHEPSSEEIDWPSSEDEEEEVTKKVEKMTLKDYTETTKGIPKFWYPVLRNANDDLFMGMIAPHDEPILEHLTNITVSLASPNNTGFTLTFHFSTNDYFTNSVLTKEYSLRPGHDKDCPLEYDGPEIFASKGCKIDWKEGQDVTDKTVKLKKFSAKGKGKGSKKEVEESTEYTLDSFFNFFNPPSVPEDPEAEISDEDKANLSVDFDVGYSIKEKIIPRAVLYFTGEIFDDDDYEDCSDEEDSDSDGVD